MAMARDGEVQCISRYVLVKVEERRRVQVDWRRRKRRRRVVTTDERVVGPMDGGGGREEDERETSKKSCTRLGVGAQFYRSLGVLLLLRLHLVNEEKLLARGRRRRRRRKLPGKRIAKMNTF